MSKVSIISACGINIRSILEAYQKESKHWSKNLQGACVTASYLMQLELQKYNIDSVIWYGKRKRFGSQHTWLEAAGFIIDLTYTQFKRDEEKVMIIAKDMPDAEWYYSTFSQGSIAPVAKQDQKEFFHSWAPMVNPLAHEKLLQKIKVA